MASQRGIALFLAVLMSLIFVVMGFGFQSQNRDMVDFLSEQQTKTMLIVETERQTSKALFRMLTTNVLATGNDVQRRTLNPDGDEPIKLTLTISTHDGKVSLMNIPRHQVTRILQPLSRSPAEADRGTDALLDWIDRDDLRRLNGAELPEYRRLGLQGPRNFPISSLDELLLIQGLDGLSPDLIEQVFTPYPAYELDLYNASVELLSLYFDNDIVAQVIQARESGGFNRRQFIQLTGDTNSQQNYTGIHFLTFTIQLSSGHIMSQKRFDIRIAPFKTVPLQFINAGG